MAGTTNTTSNWFTDWFFGHLKLQIEHQLVDTDLNVHEVVNPVTPVRYSGMFMSYSLFPTMPRHNYHKVQPYVMEFCRKHGLDYHLKPVWTVLSDVVYSLRESGQIWLKAWETAAHKDN